ncbi:unnamed protein product [Aspergillus oryzae var. brunneus]|uniref:Unnamed protein product n=1 Tax=Aspergillus oryzae var. brunneus TaxID=332754 RepID=A0ABQ6KX49_ASPOZ|nr:unnamed protein product [Aspergillus oryzae var. brunneus]
MDPFQVAQLSLINGFGVGFASMINPLYVSENAPRAIRGGLTGLYQLFITMGIMLAFWINYGSSLHIKGTAQYMVPLAMQALPALLMLVGMLLCNESPRWLAKQDRWEDARKTLSRVRNLPSTHQYIENEFQDIVNQLEHERQLIGGSGFWDLMKEMWLIPGNRKRAMISIFLMVCQQMTGTNAINYYAPQIFENLGITGTTTGLFATGVYGIVKVVACAVFLVFVADSLGRRRSLLWTSVAQGLAMLYIGLYIRIAPPVEGQPVIPAGYVALVCIFLFAACFQFGWGPVCWIYVSEIPTARLRSLNVAMAAATQWLFNFVVSRAVPNMLATVGANGHTSFSPVFVSQWACGFGSLFPKPKVFIATPPPNSSCIQWLFTGTDFSLIGLSLEKMDELFGATSSDTHLKTEDVERSASQVEGDHKDEVATETRVAPSSTSTKRKGLDRTTQYPNRRRVPNPLRKSQYKSVTNPPIKTPHNHTFSPITMNVFVALVLVALMGCPLAQAMPINGGMAYQFQPSLSAHAGLAVGLSVGIPLLAGMANDIWLYNKIMKSTIGGFGNSL